MSVRPLVPVLAEKAKKELNEDPNRTPKDLQHLKDWIAKQPHLRARTDDQWLLAFLRGCKFSLERAKEKIDLYYSLRSTAPELYSVKFNSPRFKEIIELGAIINLPNTAGPDCPRIHLIRPGAYDADKVNINEVLSVAHELDKIDWLEDDNLIVAGVETILDLEGVTMSHFLQMNPLQMKKMVTAGQDAAPVRMKGTHYLNTPPGFETIFNAINSLLNEKNRKRAHVHNKNFEALYKHIPKEILPAEYGGKAGTIKEIVDHWKKKVEEHSSFLEEDLKYGTDETRRPGKPKTAETMFGVEGSFRQLEFD